MSERIYQIRRVVQVGAKVATFQAGVIQGDSFTVYKSRTADGTTGDAELTAFLAIYGRMALLVNHSLAKRIDIHPSTENVYQRALNTM